MKRNYGLLLTVIFALTLTACAGKKKEAPEPVQETAPVVTQTNNDPYGVGMSADQLRALGIAGNPLDYTTVYFEYNSSAIDRRSEVIATAHANELRRRGGAKVKLEGHADERGTRDYNLALGERRSQAVANLMSSVGAGNSSLQVVSFGEERPVDRAHNEAAWQKNRRVEILY
ncbi:MAG: OmpA family protein [Gammaproteobacteria bacterium]|nr:OmpA family protein [Gammaproteobacteria bacterium]